MIITTGAFRSSHARPCTVSGCKTAVYHPASDYCSTHVHEARCFDVAAVDPSDDRNRADLVVIAVSEADARRMAEERLASRMRGHWSIVSLGEMALAEAG